MNNDLVKIIKDRKKQLEQVLNNDLDNDQAKVIKPKKPKKPKVKDQNSKQLGQQQEQQSRSNNNSNNNNNNNINNFHIYILVSTLKRTLETALYGCEKLLPSNIPQLSNEIFGDDIVADNNNNEDQHQHHEINVKWIGLDSIREFCQTPEYHPCDYRRKLSEDFAFRGGGRAKDFDADNADADKYKHIDFSLCPDEDPLHPGEIYADVDGRINNFLELLKKIVNEKESQSASAAASAAANDDIDIDSDTEMRDTEMSFNKDNKDHNEFNNNNNNNNKNKKNTNKNTNNGGIFIVISHHGYISRFFHKVLGSSAITVANCEIKIVSLYDIFSSIDFANKINTKPKLL